MGKNANTTKTVPATEQPSAAGTEARTDTVQPQEAAASTAETATSQENAAAESEANPQALTSAPTPAEFPEVVTIAVCGTTESLTTSEKIWRRQAADATIHTVCIDGKTFPEVIDTLMADDRIPDTFVLVPAYCFPTHPLTLADLIAYRVRRMRQSAASDAMETVAWTGLPMLIQSDAVLETLKRLGDTYTEEEFVAAYNAVVYPDNIPDEIGMTFGNAVAYVTKQPSCMARFAEMLVRKKFICANEVGFPFIKEQLKVLHGKK